MKPHVKLYMDHFGYDQSDFIGCEACGRGNVEIHHIKARGMGGTKKPEDINNLMALCRIHHEMYGDKSQYMDFLKAIHKNTLDNFEITK